MQKAQNSQNYCKQEKTVLWNCNDPWFEHLLYANCDSATLT